MDRRSFLAGGAAAAALSSAEAAAQANALAPAAAYSAQRAGDALVILRNGITLIEDFPNGGPNTPHPIGAATASFVPALAAALVADRLLTLDELAAVTLGDWALHPRKSRITIRMLLDRTCGISGERRAMSDYEACALEPVAEPGERFINDPAPTQIFAEVARRKLAGAGGASDAGNYLTLRVLSPVGCAPVNWRRENNEIRLTEGASLTARAWARWGELMRRVGVWRASQIVDGPALRDACRGSWVQPRYGFGVWLAWPAQRTPTFEGSDLWSSPDVPQDLVMAASDQGDRLFILPTQRMVIARQASRAAGWSDAAFLSAILAAR
ncbi:MAG: serine hydrolase [Hyphomonadaceae bacterium]